MRIRSQKDFASGLMFVLVGLSFSFVARTYSMGTAAKMGPGYFPFLLGLVLALLGVIVTFGSLSVKGEEDQLARWDLKTLLWILGSVVLFGLLLKPLHGVVGVRAGGGVVDGEPRVQLEGRAVRGCRAGADQPGCLRLRYQSADAGVAGLHHRLRSTRKWNCSITLPWASPRH